MKTGVVLLAHGARDASWARPFEAIASRLQESDGTLAVQLAYLEHMAPDFATAVEALRQAGCERLHVMPLFLGSGGHVQRDVPRLVAEERAKHPQLRFLVNAPAGECESIIDAMASETLRFVRSS